MYINIYIHLCAFIVFAIFSIHHVHINIYENIFNIDNTRRNLLRAISFNCMIIFVDILLYTIMYTNTNRWIIIIIRHDALVFKVIIIIIITHRNRQRFQDYTDSARVIVSSHWTVGDRIETFIFKIFIRLYITKIDTNAVRRGRESDGEGEKTVSGIIVVYIVMV